MRECERNRISTKTTDEKVAKLDKKLEEPPSIQEDLIIQYKKEKEEKLRLDQVVDNIKERSEENSRLFVLSEKKIVFQILKMASRFTIKKI